MRTYKLTYTFNKKEKCVNRKANNAVEAINKLTNQYCWNWEVSLIDADTCGNEWCVGIVDRDGGINCNMRIVATLIDRR